MAQRGDPERFLMLARHEESRSRRGRLRVLLGMAPGVGKTYSMLSEAHRLAGQGVDVVVGIVESHGRAETEQLLLGLDILPLRQIDYRGTTLREFDLDAALRRRPEVLLVDELAHTNAAGSRFDKRWRDVQACLDAGIGVWTTLNVQHIESLNDVVAQITGVTVRETVPDAVLEDADEIEVVDLPPDALLERLRAGKVYLPTVIAAAQTSFFRRANLAALRELVLRHAAALVDRQLDRERRGDGVRGVRTTADRMLVCVGPSPTSRNLLRAARRLAASMRAQLLAVHVEGGRGGDEPAIVETMRLALSLGAEPISLPIPAGSDAVNELLHLARSRNVTKIVVGRTGRSRLRAALFGSFADEIIRRSDDISIYIMRGDELDDAVDGDSPAGRGTSARPPADHSSSRTGARRSPLAALLGSLWITAIACVISWLLFTPPDLSDEAMVFVCSVAISAWWLGRRASMLASVLGVLAFNFLFTEPRFTFRVDDPRQIVTFVLMFAVGLLVGTLTSRLRRQAEEAREGERRSAALASLTRTLSRARDAREVADAACRELAETFATDAIIFERPTRADGATPEVMTLGHAGAPDWFDGRERGVARWVLDHGRTAGLGTTVLPGGHGRFVPLDAPHGRMGGVALRPHHPGEFLLASTLLLLDAFAAQIGLALERVALIEDRQRSRLAMESERLRSALLSSVSHDLRTPLAAIAGSAAALADPESHIDADTRRELLRSIEEESHRLAELVSNLVFATRLEHGVELSRAWTTVEEIVGAGLAPLRDRLVGRNIRVAVPQDLPLIRVDDALLPQVVKNLVENALTHSDPEARIDLVAWREDDRIVVRVADEGPGLAQGEAELVFDRFYRGRGERRGEHAGLGLGLTICRGIVVAHGGRIWAEPNAPRGVAFLFSLPIEAAPPVPSAEEELGSSPIGDSA